MGNTKTTTPPTVDSPGNPPRPLRTDPANGDSMRRTPPKRFADPPLPEPYAKRLGGLLQFRDLASAEESLRRLDAAYCEYQQQSDHRGVRLVRSLALKGKRRAGSMARDSRVNAIKRQEKQEIADWFRIWLQSPGLFFDWLELRKETSEFQALFAAGSEARREAISDSNIEEGT